MTQEPLTYREAMKRFSPNARLYLAYAAMSRINSTIFLVAFAFYLEEVFFPGVEVAGFQLGVYTFIGLALAVEALVHGLNSIPSGFIGDRYGRKKSFIIASLVAVTAGAGILVATEPLVLLGLAAIVGAGESFHGVVGGPFMMENSQEPERMHLFTISGILVTFSTILGAMLGGFLPGAFSSLAVGLEGSGIGEGGTHATALRLTLLMAVPFGLLELVPLFFMKESYATHDLSLGDMVFLRHIQNKAVVAKFSLLTLFLAAGLGLYLPLLNLHFGEAYGVFAAEFGPITALNSLVTGLAMVVVPTLVLRWGKVKTIAYTRLLAVPFLILLALVQSLWLAVFFFVLRGAFAGMAFPVSRAYTMEAVRSAERATTAGFIHAAFDIAFGAAILGAGLLLQFGGFWLAFVIGGLLYTVHAILWLRWFDDENLADDDE